MIWLAKLIADIVVIICVGGGEVIGYLWKTVTNLFVTKSAPSPTDILVEMVALKIMETPTLGENHPTWSRSGMGPGPRWFSDDKKIELRFSLDSTLPGKILFLNVGDTSLPITEPHKKKILEALIKSHELARKAQQAQNRRDLELLACDAIASLSPSPD